MVSIHFMTNFASEYFSSFHFWSAVLKTGQFKDMRPLRLAVVLKTRQFKDGSPKGTMVVLKNGQIKDG